MQCTTIDPLFWVARYPAVNARAPFQYGGQLCGVNKLGRNTQAVFIWEAEQLVSEQ